MISKTNQTTGEFTSYTYNLENRLASAEIQRVETDQSGDSHNVSISTSYTYNQSGIRITADSTTSVDGGTGFDTLRTFLVDPRNHTGYAQVLEEFRDAAPTPVRTYTIGNDVVSDSGQFLLYDGHGSTRLLTDIDGEVTDRLSYDAYGNMLKKQPGALTPPATDLTYAGEQFDAELGMGYNRARYCSLTTGTWNRLDPYEGNQFDPQSLNKYGYCLGNPVGGTDPSGQINLLSLLSGGYLSTGLRTAYQGAGYGAITNSVFSVIVQIAGGRTPLDPEFWAELAIDATQGALAGALSAVIGLNCGSAKSIRGAVTLTALLRYVAIPSFLKAVVGTALAMHDDVVLNSNPVWSLRKISGTIIFATVFNSTFDLGKLEARRGYAGGDPKRLKKIRKAYVARHKIWMDDPSRADQNKMMELVLAMQKIEHRLSWMDSAWVNVVFRLTKKFSKAIAPHP